MNATSDDHTVLPCLALLLAAASVLGTATYGAETGYRGLICRGVEESGRLFIGQPGFGPHLVSLVVTGPNPLSATHTLEQHVAWVNDPLHSYVPDGTGGLCVWAHPTSRDASGILALPGLTGLEVHCAGDGTSRDALWDEVLTGCCDRGRHALHYSRQPIVVRGSRAAGERSRGQSCVACRCVLRVQRPDHHRCHGCGPHSVSEAWSNV